MGRGHIGHDLGSHKGFAWYVPSHMRPFLFGFIFHSVAFLHLE